MKKIWYIFYLLVLTLGFAVSALAQTPPDLVLVKTGTPTHFANGDTITYQLIAINNTNVSQPNLTIVDNVPTAFVVTSVHDLRHCAVTNFRKAGVGDSVIMSISGHKTHAVFRRYDRVDREDRQNALRKLEILMDTARTTVENQNPLSQESGSNPL